MDNTLLDLAKTRKSTRKFTDRSVNVRDILYALNVACNAPSGANEQPWRFIVVNDTDLKKRLREACERGEKHLYDNVKGKFKEWLISQGLSHEKPFLEEAPYLIVVLMMKTAKYARESVWVSMGHLLLALEEKGLGTLAYTPTNTNYPLDELDAPKGFEIEAILPVGYSGDKGPRSLKREFVESVFMNNWGNTDYI